MVATVVLALLAWGQNAAAGGFFLYEIGTPAAGSAAAGAGASAKDASTLFTNPAGMTLLPKSQLLVGVQPIYGRLQFHPDSANKVAGTDGGNALIPLPGGSFFFVYGVSDRLKV